MLAVAQVESSRGLSAERVEWHLWNWQRWMDSGTSGGDYPKRASGGVEGYSIMGNIYDADGMYDEVNRVAGAAVQAIIDGMAQRLRIAVYVQHGIMAAVYRLRDAEVAYAEACGILALQLARRGMC